MREFPLNNAVVNNPDADDYFDSCEPNILVPDYFAKIRTHTEAVLGVVGKDYELVQNLQAFQLFDSIVGGCGASTMKQLEH